MINKSIDEKAIGKKMLQTAVKMEESLAELLRVEVRILKKQIKNDYSYDEIQHINKVIKNIILTLTIIDDRIQTGIDLLNK